jgi:hypothetical protein
VGKCGFQQFWGDFLLHLELLAESVEGVLFRQGLFAFVVLLDGQVLLHR